jgi:hypothetical protein
MNQQGRLLTFVIDEPFDRSLRMLRRALALERLHVPHELDTATRLRQELGIGLRQNTVLYVDDPIVLLEATVMNAGGALFVPEPVVLSGLDRGCRLSLRSVEPVLTSDLPASLRGAVTVLHDRILSVLARIAQRETAVPGISTSGAVSA